jgi:hypothetical protein
MVEETFHITACEKHCQYIMLLPVVEVVSDVSLK